MIIILTINTISQDVKLNTNTGDDVPMAVVKDVFLALLVLQGIDVEKLQHEYDTTRGLWCIDRDPKEVDLEWIRENAFQLT